MIIEQNEYIAIYKTGLIHHISETELISILKFKPKHDEFFFSLDGEQCAIWPLYGRDKDKLWACCGNHTKLSLLFGNKYEPLGRMNKCIFNQKSD